MAGPVSEVGTIRSALRPLCSDIEVQHAQTVKRQNIAIYHNS